MQKIILIIFFTFPYLMTQAQTTRELGRIKGGVLQEVKLDNLTTVTLRNPNSPKMDTLLISESNVKIEDAATSDSSFVLLLNFGMGFGVSVGKMSNGKWENKLLSLEMSFYFLRGYIKEGEQMMDFKYKLGEFGTIIQQIERYTFSKSRELMMRSLVIEEKKIKVNFDKMELEVAK